MMNEESIRKYAKLMKELELTGIEIKEDNTSIRLERQCAPAVPVQVAAPSAGIAPAAASETPSANTSAQTITSPMVGVFYAAPAENAEPYVKAGDHVKKGDTLCIIEAMKLMNEIPAEFDGVIAEVCATNGMVVEYGAPLFRIEG